MKKVSTIAAKSSKKISQPRLTIGLDLGDRNSWYCMLDESGQIQREQRVRTNATALREAFGEMAHSRIALEIGTHSPWISRLLSALGHEVMVANARKVRLIGESRKKDDRLDAQTLARLARIDPQLLYPVKHRSAQAQADLMMIRARAGLVRARTGLVNTARGLAKSYGERLRGCNVRNMNPKKAEGLSPELQKRAGAAAGMHRIGERADSRVQRTDREARARELSAGGAAEADQGSRHADRADVPADTGRRAPLPQEPRRGLLSGAAAGAQKLGTERAADAHQQGGRPLSANAAGAGSTAHLGTVWCRLRSQTLGFETSRTWREERKEASHRGHREKAGGVAASPVGERRSLRAIAQQQANEVAELRKSISFQEEERQRPKPSFGDCVIRLAQVPLCKREPQGAKQIAAPAEPRTPNVHRANESLPESANGSMATA